MTFCFYPSLGAVSFLLSWSLASTTLGMEVEGAYIYDFLILKSKKEKHMVINSTYGLNPTNIAKVNLKVNRTNCLILVL